MFGILNLLFQLACRCLACVDRVSKLLIRGKTTQTAWDRDWCVLSSICDHNPDPRLSSRGCASSQSRDTAVDSPVLMRPW